MSRSDSRDSTTSTSSFTSTTMQSSFSASPLTFRSTSDTNMSSIPMRRESFVSGWIPSPYRSCMHHSSSSQSYETSSSHSYISDDDLLALEDLAMPPVEYIPSVIPASREEQQKKPEMTTEEQIAMLRDMQERESAQSQQQQRQRAQQQRTVRFAADSRKPRRPTGLSQRQSTTTRRS